MMTKDENDDENDDDDDDDGDGNILGGQWRCGLKREIFPSWPYRTATSNNDDKHK